MGEDNRAVYPRRHRIVRTSDYRAIYGIGRKVHSGSFVLFGRENSLGFHRLGITVSRKIGGAVVRNRIKRRFREIFRKSSNDHPRHFDLVVNVRKACVSAPYVALEREFLHALRSFGMRSTAGPDH